MSGLAGGAGLYDHLVTQHSFLLVAATRAEAAHVPPHLPIVVTGLGKTAAAVATTQALLSRDRTGLTVVNIGTAGALRDGLEGLHEPTAVLNHDINAEAIKALGYDAGEYLVLDGARSEHAAGGTGGNRGGDGIVLASGDLFVTDPSVRARLAQRAHLVDMEGYAVAYACRALGVSPPEAAVIGDSANDAVGGRAAGCRVLLVPYGYREGQDVRGIECDGIVASLLDAAELLLAQS